MSEGRPPESPGLRPVAGGSAVPATAGEEAARVLREFGANRAAMAAEIVRLRTLLQDALYEVSRLRAGPVQVIAPPPERPPRSAPPPPGFTPWTW